MDCFFMSAPVQFNHSSKFDYSLNFIYYQIIGVRLYFYFLDLF